MRAYRGATFSCGLAACMNRTPGTGIVLKPDGTRGTDEGVSSKLPFRLSIVCDAGRVVFRCVCYKALLRVDVDKAAFGVFFSLSFSVRMG